MMKELYLDFKKYIVWRYVIVMTLMVNIVLLFDWSFTALLGANGLVVTIVLLSYLQAKIEQKAKKKKSTNPAPPEFIRYRIREQIYNNGSVYFTPEYYDSKNRRWELVFTDKLSTYGDAMYHINSHKNILKTQTEHIIEEKIHDVE